VSGTKRPSQDARLFPRTCFSFAATARFPKILLSQQSEGDLRPEIWHLDIFEAEHDQNHRIADSQVVI